MGKAVPDQVPAPRTRGRAKSLSPFRRTSARWAAATIADCGENFPTVRSPLAAETIQDADAKPPISFRATH